MKRIFKTYTSVILLVILPTITFSQAIFYGISNTFTIGTQQYEPAPILSGYSAVFELNAMGEYITGYSNLFALNTNNVQPTWGTISGTITDSNTGAILSSANLVLTSGVFGTNPVSAFTVGNYEINTQFGYGYNLTVYANGYSPQTIEGINLTSANPNVVLNIQLESYFANLTVSSIVPNPNPLISTVLQGGTLHRYYELLEPATNLIGAGVELTVSVNNYDKIFTADENGMVDIEIESSEIGNGQPGATATFQISAINNNPLTTPVVFSCEVVEKEYAKTWDNSTFAKLGISFVEVELERGSSVSLFENNSSNLYAENIYITRQGRAMVGVDFSASATAKVTLGPVEGGASAEAGVGAGISGVTEDYYMFPHVNYDDWQAVSQYILFADGNFNSIDNTLIRLLTKCQEWFTNQSSMQNAYLGDKKGFDVQVNAHANAFAGVNATNNLQIGAQASVGTEGHVTLNMVFHDASNEIESSFGISGTLAASAGAGLHLDFSDENNSNSNSDDALKEMNGKLDLLNFEGTRGYEIAIYVDDQNYNITRAQLRFIHRNMVSGIEKLMVYEVPGAFINQAVNSFVNDIQNLSSLNQGGGLFSITKNTAKEVTQSIFNAIYNLQQTPGGAASITYTQELTEIEHSSSFEISIEGSLTSALKAEVGGGVGFEQNKSMVVEDGAWVLGKHYPRWEYTGAIPEISESYQDVVQDISDNIPTIVKFALGVVNLFSFSPNSKSDSVFYIDDSTSYVVFSQTSWPQNIDTLSCTSWGWYGNTPNQSKASLSKDAKEICEKNKSMAIASFGMDYGVGGFYQFEPYDTILPDTAWFTIHYPDSDLIGIDETTLSMYYEDKENRQWLFIGGVLDTANNTVTAPITRLALYTLAPAMPFGRFGLNANPDTIFADSISVSTIISDSIYNNDSSLVSDGQLFTVKTNQGTITTADADTSIEGLQVESLNGIIQFTLKSSHIAGQANVSALSVIGSANGRDTLQFIDTISPPAPASLMAEAGNGKVTLNWSPVNEDDLGGYIVYFDTDTTIPPYDGISTVWGKPSPIIIGVDTSYVVQGLFNDSLYHFTIKAYDISDNESEYSNIADATPFFDSTNYGTQEIVLPAGWSIFSTYLEPMNIAIDTVLQPVLTNIIIVKDWLGQVYWPQYGVNLIGNMVNGHGYQAKMLNVDTLTIEGVVLTPEENPISVVAGWSIIGYLRTNPAPVDSMMASVDPGNLSIMKDYLGQVYWPQFGVNLIGNMYPGQGYQLKLNNADTLIYPSNEINYQTVSQSIPAPQFYSKSTITGNNMTLGVPINSWQEYPEPGDEIGVFDPQGILIGAGVFEGKNMAITIWGDDRMTNLKEGATWKEPFSLRLWSKVTQTETLLNVTNWVQGNEMYELNKISVVGDVKEIEQIQHNKIILYQNQPNPFREETEFSFYLPEKTFVELTILTANGNTIEKLVSEELEAGTHQIRYQTKEVSVGNFLYRLEAEGFSETRKMVIVK